MKQHMILYWPKCVAGNSDYQLARKVINDTTGTITEVFTEDLDIASVFAQDIDTVIYYPVFCNSTGWWGELLGGQAKIIDKKIISPECQLMVIVANKDIESKGANKLLAAEIHPASGFFKKMNSSIATVSDMLATDTGTILALFTGKNQNKFINIIEDTGNFYLGCIGQY